MCDENLSALYYQEYSNQVHKKKLAEIRNRKNLTVSLSLDPQPSDPKKPKSFFKIAKMQEMARENKLLHEKLVGISKRKVSAEPKLPGGSPKTLNLGIRKRLSDQIMYENSSIIKRLIDRPPKISIKQMKIDYELSQKYKENLSKRKNLDRIKKIVKKFKLPESTPLPLPQDTQPAKESFATSTNTLPLTS